MEAQSHGVDQQGNPWYAQPVCQGDSHNHGSSWVPPYTATPKRQTPLNKIISEAYDEAIKKNMFQENPLLVQLAKKAKEKEMSDREIIDKVMNDRKKLRADAVVNELGVYFDALDTEPGYVVVWMVQFADNDKDYNYAAIYSGKRWYITNREVAYTTEQLIAEIAELALKGDVWFEGGDDPL
jgi:hypothetical protein